MLMFTTWALRLFGLSGIVGSILFIFGDLSYNHVPGSTGTPAAKMSKLAESRVLRAGVLGLPGCWLYTLACLHFYIAFQPAGELFAFIVSATFAAVMIGYGIAHAAYFSIAAGARIAEQLGSDAERGGRPGNIFFQRVTAVIYAPVAVSSLMMLYAVLTGRSLYPRWMAIFLPVFIYLIKAPVIRLLKGRLGEIVNDAYDNLVLFIFYLLSTVVLWNVI